MFGKTFRFNCSILVGLACLIALTTQSSVWGNEDDRAFPNLRATVNGKPISGSPDWPVEYIGESGGQSKYLLHLGISLFLRSRGTAGTAIRASDRRPIPHGR